MKELLKLRDGALLNIKDDIYTEEVGYPTCGLDTMYTNYLEFEFENTGVITLECRQYEDHWGNVEKSHISIGEMVRIFVDNYERFQSLTEMELVEDIKRILEDTYEDGIYIDIEMN